MYNVIYMYVNIITKLLFSEYFVFHPHTTGLPHLSPPPIKDEYAQTVDIALRTAEKAPAPGPTVGFAPPPPPPARGKDRPNPLAFAL